MPGSKKNNAAQRTASVVRTFKSLCFFLLFLCKAFAAINRSVLTRLKGNFCYSTAGITSCLKPLTLATAGVFACITASLATLGLINKAFFSIEFLFTGGENEFLSAFLASESFVFVHGSNLAVKKYLPLDGFAPSPLLCTTLFFKLRGHIITQIRFPSFFLIRVSALSTDFSLHPSAPAISE